MKMNSKYRGIWVLFAYLLWMLSSILGITLWRDFEIIKIFRTYTTQISYLMLFVSFFWKDKYYKRDVIGIMLIIYCCIVATISTHHRHIIPVVIFIYFLSDINYQTILKVTFILQCAIMVVTIAASQVGIIEDVIWVEGDRIRHSLGYDYCGYPGHLLLFMTLSLFCIKKKVRILHGIVLLALNFAVYVLTDARTDFYLSILAIVGFFSFCGQWRRKWAILLRNWIIKYSYFIVAVGSIAIHWLYDPQIYIWQKINEVLNGRLALGHEAIEQYGFTLFGQRIRWYGQGSLKADPTRVYNYVDCSFLKETLSFGIIFMVLLGIGFYCFGKCMVVSNEMTLSWAVLISFLYAVINAHFCVLTFNVFILVLGHFFSKKNYNCSELLQVH